MSRARRHPHKYRKAKLTFGTVWACALPDCNHYMPQHMSELVVGKRSICWTCDAIFVMSPENMKEEFPKCDDCKGGITETATSEIERRFLEGKA
jgi:hypothetical protein